MTQNIQNLLKKIKNIEPSRGLEGKILKAVAFQRNWQAKRKLIFADALIISSLGAFVFVMMNFWGGIARSDFWSLLKLVFSDTSAVAASWKDFLFSLLETFPAAHMAAMLAPVFFLMIALSIYFSSSNLKHHNN
jgi:hypothetical protein